MRLVGRSSAFVPRVVGVVIFFDADAGEREVVGTRQLFPVLARAVVVAAEILVSLVGGAVFPDAAVVGDRSVEPRFAGRTDRWCLRW